MLERKKVCSGEREYEYWVLRWHDPTTGRKRSESLGRADDRRAKNYVSLREAQTLARLKEAEFHVRPRRRSEGLALGDWLLMYRRQREAEGKSPRTLVLDDYCGRLLAAYFGEDRLVGRIGRADARGFWTALTAGELEHVSTSQRGMRRVSDDDEPRPRFERAGRLAASPQTWARQLRTIRTMFNRAVDDELIEANPFARIRMGKPSGSEWRQVSLVEFRKLEAAVPAEWKKVVALARLASLTRDDILDLRWDEVDLAGREIRIERNKSGVEQRVPVGDELHGRLKAWWQARATIRIDGDYVVDRSKIYLANIGRDFQRWCAKAGVPAYGKPLHDLRKSCVSDWVRLQPAANVVKLWAGHATLATTLSYYDQARDEDMAVGKGRGGERRLPRRAPKRAPTRSRRRAM